MMSIAAVFCSYTVIENLSRILRLEPASQPQNLRAEPQKLERVTPGLGETALSTIAITWMLSGTS